MPILPLLLRPRATTLSLAVLLLLGQAPLDVHAAAGTTCLCRTADGKGFEETTIRHSRWACDYKLGYASTQSGEAPSRKRPPGETCNKEEIVQYKVWACMERGCTYAFARSATRSNEPLRMIDKYAGPRKP